MNADSPRHRLGLLAIAALSLFGALFARLWFLQLVEGPALEEQVSANAQREVVIPAPRGRIISKDGQVLVDNRESITVAIDSQAYVELDEAEQERVVERLVTALNRPPDPSTGEGVPETTAPAADGVEVDLDPADDAGASDDGDGNGDEADAAPAEPRDPISIEFVERRLDDPRFSRFRPVPIVEDISVEEEIYFHEQADRFPSVVVDRQTVRAYPFGSLVAHVLGYVGAITEDEFEARQDDDGPKSYERSDEIGKSGVEATYEEYLRGTPGQRVYEVDRRNRVVREITALRQDPIPGDDVHLAIDARIQYKTEEALQARILEAEGEGATRQAGSATVLDPRNGQVRAMASYPTYDPASLVGGVSQEDYDALTDPNTKILSNRAIQEAYPAASTFKLATAYAGLQLGVTTPEEVVVDQGAYRLCPGQGQGCLKRNNNNTSYGSIALSTALTVSSNVYFYGVGVDAWSLHQAGGAPEDALQEQIGMLGYGERTGIDLTAEAEGRVPTPDSNEELADRLWEADPANYDNDEEVYRQARRWRAGYNADVAIGEFDTLVTPLQTANAYASLANGQGRLYQPSVLSHVTRTRSEEIVTPFTAEVIREVPYGDDRPTLLEGFERVVRDPQGTAHSVFADLPIDDWPVAGKTGTATVSGDSDRRNNSLFVAYGPTPSPEFVVSVLIEEGGYGGVSAAPAAAMILEPVADGSMWRFEVPPGGAIDAAAALEDATGVGRATAD
jgi:penicillin-binding protein 2